MKQIAWAHLVWRTNLTSNLGAWLGEARSKLIPTSDTPTLEAEVLCAHLLNKPRTWVVSHPEFHLTRQQVSILNHQLLELVDGVPLPHIIGHQEFFGLDFYVSRDVLIPRPETELLVEAALTWLGKNPVRRLAADIGSGSGCVAISLAYHIQDLRVIACDFSTEAIKMTMRNLSRYALSDRIFLVQSNLLDPFCAGFDLICSNPPYIPTHQLLTLLVASHEPRLALDGGPQGIDLISLIIQHIPHLLKPGGLFLCEIEAGQGKIVSEFARTILPRAAIQVLKDFQGHSRLLKIENLP